MSSENNTNDVKPENTTMSATPSSNRDQSSNVPATKEPAKDDADYDFIGHDEDELSSEPEHINHSDAVEEFEEISKEGIPEPEELDQNGKPSGKGGKQAIGRTLEEMKKDWEEKEGGKKKEKPNKNDGENGDDLLEKASGPAAVEEDKSKDGKGGVEKDA